MEALSHIALIAEVINTQPMNVHKYSQPVVNFNKKRYNCHFERDDEGWKEGGEKALLKIGARG